MATSLLVLFLAFSILSQNHVSAENDFYLPDPIHTTINSASSTKPIKDFIKLFFNASLTSAGDPEKKVEEAGILKKYIKERLKFIFGTIIELPSIIDYLDHKKELIDNFYNIASKYHTALRIQKHSFKKFQKIVNENLLDGSMSKIKDILIDKDTAVFLSENFKEDAKKFRSACTLKMSHMQLLDALLSYVQIAMAQYYTVKYLILLKSSDNNQVSDEASHELMEDIEYEYNEVVKEIKKIMPNASLDFQTCDTRIYKDDALHVQNQDSSYMELQSLSLFYMKMKKGKSSPECEKIKEQEACVNPDRFKLCAITRECPNGFLKCNRLFPNETDGQARWLHYKTICRHLDTTAHHRYDQVFETVRDKDEPPKCKPDKVPETIQVYDGNTIRNCECLCIEKNYYFVQNLVTSNYSDHRVVTGARIVVEENFIFVQIQEAKVLANGNIDKSTLRWKPIQKENFLRDLVHKKHSLESVDLSEANVTSGHVVTGLRFQVHHIDNRVKLIVYSHPYNHTTGKLNTTERYNNEPDDATVEYKTYGQDASTRASTPNMPVSKTNQYIAFNITDPQKDGGQTTIPFIDTQKVESEQPTPLSGAGLYLRGQPDYGGFLALKLYSYNIEPYVNLTMTSIKFN